MTSSSSKAEKDDLASLLSRAVEDVWSQAGRVGPDVTTARNIAMTTFAGGVVDDRKYIVSPNRVPLYSVC
jgi:hypothetical protein